MNYLQRYIQEVRSLLFFSFLTNNILLVMLAYYVITVWSPPIPVLLGVIIAGTVIINFIMERIITRIIMHPLQLLWQNILHTAPTTNLDSDTNHKAAIGVGLDLVDHLSRYVHQLAMAAYRNESSPTGSPTDPHRNFIASSLPLPLIVLDKEGRISFANMAAERYFGIADKDLANQSLQHVIGLEFGQAEQSLANWLEQAKQGAATAGRSWDDVRYKRGEDDSLHFDMAAFYNRDNPEGIETILVFFDHTATYSQFDADIGFVSLAIHELRTPVTMLRGYIEALDEDLSDVLNDDTKQFFDKMQVSSRQLTGFIDNILKVARIEGNQFDVQLREENWGSILESVTEDLRLRAAVRGLELQVEIAEGLPSVGVDRFSILTVVTNLADNAIKYSAGKGTRIIIRTEMNGDGMVQTTVRDYGVGIAANVTPTIFGKFQRNFHNRGSVGGSGIGLYLAKVIVTLHGGNIWVSSKVGKGTTVGFTIVPYKDIGKDKLADKNGNLVPSSHGWIKNHSMSRR